MTYEFTRTWRLIERLFPGNRSSGQGPSPKLVNDIIQPTWPAFAVRQSESSLRLFSAQNAAPSAGTNSFQLETAGAGRVILPVLVRVFHSNGGVLTVGTILQQNTISTERLQQDPWMMWRSSGGTGPTRTIGLEAVASSGTATIPVPVPVIPEGNTLLVQFFGVAAGVGTLDVEIYYIEAPMEIVTLQTLLRYQA